MKLRHTNTGREVTVREKSAQVYLANGWTEVVDEPTGDEPTGEGEQPDEQPDEGSGDEGVSDDAGKRRGRRAVSAKAAQRGAEGDGD